MTRNGIILYGPPGSGKDTITSALAMLNSRYVPFARLKAGGGRSTGYRITDRFHIEDLERRGLILYRNERYGATYAIDRPELEAVFEKDGIPILHIGQLAGVQAVLRYPADWLTVKLWCSRLTAEHRIRSRGSTDVTTRLAAWDETLDDLMTTDNKCFALSINTDDMAPEEAAATISDHFVDAMMGKWQ